MVSTTMRKQTLCTGYYDSIHLDIQHVLYDYIHKYHISLEYLDDLVVNQLHLETKVYRYTVPIECFGLADMDQQQCEQVLKILESYVKERRNESLIWEFGQELGSKLIAEIEAKERIE